MFIKNDDLILLLDIDTYILKTLNNTHNTQDGKQLHDDVIKLVNELLKKKKDTNKKNYKRIKEKRKTNKNYAREKRKEV